MPLSATLTMPYAPPAGWGASRAAAVLAPGAGRSFHVIDHTITVKAPAASTGGAFSVLEMTCPPGSGAPPHRQQDDEWFYVLDGELTFMIDWAERTAAAGSWVFVPRGTPHCFANRSGRDARALVLCAPGGPLEAMFAALDAWGRAGGPGGGPPDAAALPAICRAHGVELLAPPSDPPAA